MAGYTRYQDIKVEVSDGIAVLTLNRPQALNAFNPRLHQELEDLFEEVAGDGSVRAAVLTGAGRAFSAGGDLREMLKRIEDPTVARVPMEGARHMVHNLLKVEQPLIAALNGDAVGLGATVALFCDVIIAAETARIGDPHVRVGLVAGDGGCVIWPLLIGVAKAKEMLMTGDLMSAKDAERIGLINHVVPPEIVMPRALELARRLADGPTQAIRWTKLAVNKVLRERVDLILDTSLALEFHTMNSSDHAEAVRAFLEKRAPRFRRGN